MMDNGKQHQPACNLCVPMMDNGKQYEYKINRLGWKFLKKIAFYPPKILMAGAYNYSGGSPNTPFLI